MQEIKRKLHFVLCKKTTLNQGCFIMLYVTFMCVLFLFYKFSPSMLYVTNSLTLSTWIVGESILAFLLPLISTPQLSNLSPRSFIFLGSPFTSSKNSFVGSHLYFRIKSDNELFPDVGKLLFSIFHI